MIRTPWDDLVDRAVARGLSSSDGDTRAPEREPRFLRGLARYAVAQEAPWRVWQRLVRQATEDMTAVLKQFPECTAALDVRGMAWNDLGKFTAALADFDRVLRADPGDTLALEGRADAHCALAGVIRMDSGHALFAAADLEQLVRACPEDPSPHVKLGRLKLRVGTLALNAPPDERRRHLDEAAAHFENALRLDPTHRAARARLVRALAARITASEDGETDALAHRLACAFREAVEAHAADPFLHETFGRAMALAGRFDEALASLQVALAGQWSDRCARRGIEATIRQIQMRRERCD